MTLPPLSGEDSRPRAGTPPLHNVPEQSVTELANALKRTVEDSFGRVRVRGEISQPKLAGSGHCYLRLKDDGAVIDGIIWRGSYAKLSIRPEEGLEVIASGRLTTYPGRSSYQIVIESLELAGEGALLKMLEERKRRLAAEGLFDQAGKKPLPRLPRRIGVVTSPTGAVIRDILHRLNDRFPLHVLVWPVLVQGEGAASQVAAAIDGFNALPAGGPVPRPDLLIVARGGGSLDDLMAFNEERVVRAVAASQIPLISAIGHETDTTLCDLAADLRAPTPTGAAEMAVPVRLDLLAQVREDSQRLTAAVRRLSDERALRLQGLVRGLPPLERLVDDYSQRLDDRVARLDSSVSATLERRQAAVRQLAAALRSPREQLAGKETALAGATAGLRQAATWVLRDAARRSDQAASRLSPQRLQNSLGRGNSDVNALGERLRATGQRLLEQATQGLDSRSRRLAASSHESVLRRGYAILRHAGDGEAVIEDPASVSPGMALTVELHGGRIAVTAGHGTPDPATGSPETGGLAGEGPAKEGAAKEGALAAGTAPPARRSRKTAGGSKGSKGGTGGSGGTGGGGTGGGGDDRQSSLF